MNKTIGEIFGGFLDTCPDVWNYSKNWGVITICTVVNSDFMKSFNHWNECHGVVLSLIKLDNLTYIVYTGNGVKITDLTQQ